MSLRNDKSKRIPEYYNTMYQDGYTPEEIRFAAHRDMIDEYRERESTFFTQKTLDDALEKALKKLFKNFK